MIALNDRGKWGTVDKILPLSIRYVQDNQAEIWTAGVGVVLFKEVESQVPFGQPGHLDEEVINRMCGWITKDKGLYGEFYGLTFFDPRVPDEPWIAQVRTFMQDPSTHELVHPRRMTAGTPYLFFARRFVQHVHRHRRGAIG